MFEIERGVPIPVKNGGTGLQDALRSMEVSDSVFVPDKTYKQIVNSYNGAKWADGKKFTARTVEGGTRIWRIK